MLYPLSYEGDARALLPRRPPSGHRCGVESGSAVRAAPQVSAEVPPGTAAGEAPEGAHDRSLRLVSHSSSASRLISSSRGARVTAILRTRSALASSADPKDSASQSSTRRAASRRTPPGGPLVAVSAGLPPHVGGDRRSRSAMPGHDAIGSPGPSRPGCLTGRGSRRAGRAAGMNAGSFVSPCVHSRMGALTCARGW